MVVLIAGMDMKERKKLMSDDLISRKALLEKLEVFNDRDHGNEHFLLGIESAKEIIKNEPAAFDKKR